MLPTYPAVLSGDRIVWSGDAPGGLNGASVPVHVTLLALPLSTVEKRKRMVAALEEIAARGGLSAEVRPSGGQSEALPVLVDTNPTRQF